LKLKGVCRQKCALRFRTGKIHHPQRSYGTAQFEFPGEDGDYVIRVHYLEETPGKTTLSVSVKDPEPAPEAQ